MTKNTDPAATYAERLAYLHKHFPDWFPMPKQPTTAMLIDMGLAYENFVQREGRNKDGTVPPQVAIRGMEYAYRELFKYAGVPEEG
ncbi:hypothetical protein [Burkholderia cepacia]|uniref:hypothetical protein n=1 Tax=Burkholderia cepacia TaxID=292 RepID=UPI002FE3AD4F